VADSPLPTTTKSVLRARLEVRYLGNVFQTTFPYISTADAVIDDLVGAAAAIEAQLRTAVRNALPTGATYLGFLVDDLNQPLRLPVRAEGGGTVPGLAGDAGATQIAALIKRQTARRGRHGRGFNYFSPVPQVAAEGGIFTPEYMDLINGLRDAMIEPILDVGGGTLLIAVAKVAIVTGTRVVQAAACTEVSTSNIPTDRSTRKLGRGE